MLAEDSQRAGRTFAGLVFAHQRKVSFGEMVGDLELVAKATDSAFVAAACIFFTRWRGSRLTVSD